MASFSLETKTRIKENNFIVGGREYKGTPGLWELMVSTEPDDGIYTSGDYDNYAEIMVKSNTLYRNNDENETGPKANKSWKWRHILKPIWEQKDLNTGDGIPLSFYPVIQMHC